MNSLSQIVRPFGLGLVVSMLLLAAGSAQAKEYEFVEKKVFAAGPGLELEINYFGGNIEVSSHDVDRVVLRIIKRIEAVSMDEARYLADNVVVKAKQTRTSLTINTNFLKKIKKAKSLWGKLIGSSSSDPYGSVDFIVLVPRQCALKISNNMGNVKIRDLTGSIEIRSSASDIELNSIDGNIMINNAGGSTNGEMLFGEIVVNQPMGSIDLRYVEGDIRIKSSSASINILQEKGSLDLSTTTGDVVIRSRVYTGRDCFVSTESGDITLSLPRSLSGTLLIKSDLGNIKTQMPITIESVSKKSLVGHLGAGGVRITLSSITGDVTVAEY